MAWLVKASATKVEDVSSSHRSDMIEMGNYFHKLFSEVQCAHYGTGKPMFWPAPILTFATCFLSETNGHYAYGMRY